MQMCLSLVGIACISLFIIEALPTSNHCQYYPLEVRSSLELLKMVDKYHFGRVNKSHRSIQSNTRRGYKTVESRNKCLQEADYYLTVSHHEDIPVRIDVVCQGGPFSYNESGVNFTYRCQQTKVPYKVKIWRPNCTSYYQLRYLKTGCVVKLIA